VECGGECVGDVFGDGGDWGVAGVVGGLYEEGEGVAFVTSTDTY
jgi:hypothetical protein